LCLRDEKVKLINFSRNFGHQAAICAGLERAKGDVIAIIDDDLQDPPELIPKFIDRLLEGNDVVYGVRRKRKEKVWKRISFYFFYRLLKLMSGNDIPYDSGDFCVMNRRTVEVIKGFKEGNKFLRGIRSWIGFRQVGIEYEREPRLEGRSQYTLRKYFRFAFNAIFSFSYLPLRISTILGLSAAGISILYGIFILYKKLAGHIEDVPGFAALFVAISFLGGIILICLGVIGEYIARLYDELKGRPQFIIKEEIGFQ